MNQIFRITLVTAWAFVMVHVSSPAQSNVTLTVLYDNYACSPLTTTHWGFSCLVNGLGKLLLFDTGAANGYLASNASVLGVDLSSVELAMISHDHSDHIGGIDSAYKAGSNVTVYVGSRFSTTTEQRITSTGAQCLRASASVSLTPHAFTTGEVTGVPYETGLVISTDSGLVVILGCSHPGVIEMLTRVQQLSDSPLYMVLGGFHWLNFTSTQVSALIQAMKAMGVKKCGATHCTGAAAIDQVRQAFGPDFVEMGAGRIITLPLSATSVEDVGDLGGMLPDNGDLGQNFPNPFNPETTIGFRMKERGWVKLSVMNVLGQEVALLVDEEKEAGHHEAVFGSQTSVVSIPSGVYFYRMSATTANSQRYEATKRMVMVK